ncbi:MAG TPA: hypothetical protein VER37_09570 [Thermomicrobiales bacterium]|nr:hypothetical protein [Thermomicrobiales bacterium]
MLESFRRRMADELEGWRRVIDDAGRTLVDAGAYPSLDAYRREVAGYSAHLLTTVAAMDGDISPDEMLAMLFAGMGGVSSPQQYFGAIEGMQHQLLHRSEALEDIPLFLERAADNDLAQGTALAATVTDALLRMAETVMVADLADDASERLFLDGYRLQLARFFEERGIERRPGPGQLPMPRRPVSDG